MKSFGNVIQPPLPDANRRDCGQPITSAQEPTCLRTVRNQGAGLDRGFHTLFGRGCAAKPFADVSGRASIRATILRQPMNSHVEQALAYDHNILENELETRCFESLDNDCSVDSDGYGQTDLEGFNAQIDPKGALDHFGLAIVYQNQSWLVRVAGLRSGSRTSQVGYRCPCLAFDDYHFRRTILRRQWNCSSLDFYENSLSVPSLILATSVYLLTCFNGMGAQQVSGTVTGTWRAADGPYYVIGECTVAAGSSLRVEPGVTIIMGPGVRLNIFGGTSFDGTADKPITIRASTANAAWDAISVYQSDQTQSFKYCSFSDAKTGLLLSVEEGTMKVTIANCVFQNCEEGISGLSQGIIHGNGFLASCTWTAPTLNPLISNCSFVACGNGCVFTIAGSFGNCNSLYPGLAPGSSSPIIRNSIFKNLRGKAIWFKALEHSGASTPTILNNTIRNCPAGVSIADPFDARLVNNIFASTQTAISRQGQGSAKVSNNCFFANGVNFSGYGSSPLGVIVQVNRRSTPCDIAFNILENPLFASLDSLRLAPGSACVDAGVDESPNDESCFPPSYGDRLPDLGAYGGAYSCRWPVDAGSTRVIPMGIARVVEIRFQSEKGRHYILFGSSDLNSLKEVSSISALGGEQAIYLPIEDDQRYFVLKEVIESQ